MAELKGSILGFISGKVGGLVVRKVNGKNFVSHRPAKYKKTKSEKAKLVRGKFAVTVEFARTVKSIPELSNVWLNAEINGTSAYHRIIKYNSKLVGENIPSVKNIITPGGLKIMPDNFILNADNIIADYKPGEILLYKERFTSLSVIAVLVFHEPAVKSTSNFIIKDMSLKGIKINETINCAFLLPFSKSLMPYFNKYKKMIVYTSLIFNCTVRQNPFWSISASKQFNLNQ